MPTNFHTNVGSADIAAFLRFQTGFRPLWDVHKFPYKCRISGSSCFPTVSDGFRPVSDLFGTPTNFHTNVGSADIAAFLQFQACFRPLWDARKFPYKCRISGHSCCPTFSDSFRPVSDLFGTSTKFHTNVGSADIAAFLVSDLFGTPTNFHTNVGSAEIAAFLQFQTVSDLFQTFLGCPQISIQM